jgi:phosphoribosylformylglycinamidine (FGAM) synthase-like enzyme
MVALLPGEGADLVRFVWQNAERFSLAHDVSWGGLAKAIREAADWSGIDAELDIVEGGGVIVAFAGEAPGWDSLVELGTV